jgi:hypothetical protein
MKKVFNWRVLTCLGSFLSFIVLLVSGVILCFFPEGGSSGFIRHIGGLTKPAWLNRQIMFGIAFALFSIFHLFNINREAFFSYLKKSSL